MNPSIVSAMDKDALKKQIENMKYQATMERWPLSKSIAATFSSVSKAVSKATPPKKVTPVSEIEIQASQIIERLEEAVEKATDAVTLLEHSSEKDPKFRETDLGLKGESWSINQGFLQPKSRSVPQILGLLEDLIVFENNEDLEESEGLTVTSLAPLSNIAKLSLVIQSVGAFANTLDRTHLNNLNNRIHNDTTRWITHLFRFYESQAFYHNEPLEGLVRLTRMLLHYKYPKYLEVGFECLTANPPVIYSTTFSSLGIVQHLCRQLGLSLSCVHAVPSGNDFASQQNMDINCLERIIQEGKASNKIPLLLLADAGTPITGHVDNLLRLQDICRQHDIWLHVRGHSLATLAMGNATNVPSRIADSMTLSLGTWLGVPGLPTVSLYRPIQASAGRTTGVPREMTLPLIAGLVADQLQKRLVALPLWFTLQGLGREEIQLRIKEAFEKTHILWDKLSKYSCLRLLSQRPGGDSGSLTVQDLINKPVTTSTLIFEMTASTIVFQFTPESETPGVQYTSKVPPYFNKLNSWLGQILQQDIPQINIEICDLEYAGLVLRICPLEAIIPISNSDVDLLVSCLEQQLGHLTKWWTKEEWRWRVCLGWQPAPPTQGRNDFMPANRFRRTSDGHRQVPFQSPRTTGREYRRPILPPDLQGKTHEDILSATVRLKSVFQQSVESNPSLRLVEMEGWAGLGGVRYVPEYLENVDTEESKQDLNKLNAEIVSKLRATDAAFSLGEGGDGLVCVRFGMVTAETDVEELLSLVTTIGKDVEESSKYLDTMVEIVKKGIETATMDLQKENEDRLWQEGILRHVPVFGTIVNWWSPKAKETGIKGRSLNLQAGVVESTENIYRYHMQLQQGASSPPGTKSPPQPLVQTPIVTDSSSRHSRSSSHCSQVSQKSTEPKSTNVVSDNPISDG